MDEYGRERAICAMYLLHLKYNRRLTMQQIEFALSCNNRLGTSKLGRLRQDIMQAIGHSKLITRVLTQLKEMKNGS